MRRLLFAVFSVTILFSCNQPKNQFEITGNLEGIKNGWVVLGKIVDNNFAPIDSLMADDGKFNFKGTVDMPEMYYLHFKSEREYLGFFVEPGHLKISGTLAQAVYDGLPTQQLYTHLAEDLSDYDQEYEEISQQYRNASALNDEPTMRAIEKRALEIETSRTEDLLNFANTNNKSVIAPFILLNNLQNFEIEKVIRSMENLDSSVHQSTYYIALNEEVEKLRKVAIGSQAPLFSQNDPEGNPVLLESFRGKYLLIDFWASWCKPCRVENPNIVAAYDKYHQKGFDILSVSLDRDKNAWLKGIADDNLHWNHVSDLRYWNNEVSRLYSVNSIPASFLLNPEGIIIAKDLRGEQLHQKLAELLD